MTKSLILLLLLTSLNIDAQHRIRLNKTEYFTISGSVDPKSSIKESGLNLVGEIEYVGFVYAKVGFETFSALYGDYSDFHGSFGINLTAGLYEKMRFYSGLRLAKVRRGSHGFRPIYGFEGGIDYDITDYFFIGIRGTLDKRFDQEIFGWKPELTGSGFIRIGYKWFYKKR